MNAALSELSLSELLGRLSVLSAGLSAELPAMAAMSAVSSAVSAVPCASLSDAPAALSGTLSSLSVLSVLSVLSALSLLPVSAVCSELSTLSPSAGSVEPEPIDSPVSAPDVSSLETSESVSDLSLVSSDPSVLSEVPVALAGTLPYTVVFSLVLLVAVVLESAVVFTAAVMLEEDNADGPSTDESLLASLGSSSSPLSPSSGSSLPAALPSFSRRIMAMEPSARTSLL
mmetsp:Transcript_44230/g.96222  ORF Transcript_44230/g.96222 Transcript_44230/m.96222 type:complete len:229 (-) Transcript_44230:117-803(-)